jgi:hypothetical protein
VWLLLSRLALAWTAASSAAAVSRSISFGGADYNAGVALSILLLLSKQCVVQL